MFLGTGSMECHFFFDPQLGDLVSLEAHVDPELDPCELYFSDVREAGGHWLPRRIEVRYGDQLYTYRPREMAGLRRP
ncbi:MAG: hypothetical protein QM775_17640 [Pirellulales bacterium]